MILVTVMVFVATKPLVVVAIASVVEERLVVVLAMMVEGRRGLAAMVATVAGGGR